MTKQDIDYDALDSTFNICEECIKDNKFKYYFNSKKKFKRKCSLCERTRNCIDVHKCEDFFNFLTALIRYHYREEDYNEHWGGVRIYTLLLKDEFIFNNKNFSSKEYHLSNICEFLAEELGNYYMKHNGTVELYAGHYDGMRECFFSSLKESIGSTKNFEDLLLNENYFLHTEDIKNILSRYVNSLTNTLHKDETFYRARIGFEKKITYDAGWGNMLNKYIPYKGDKISSPKPYLASGGRLNRQGVSFLYLATDVQTAISEVRPDPSHKVSIGKFKCKQDIKIVDFNKAFVLLSENEKTLASYSVLNHLDQLFSQPIIPSDRHLYIITQVFADIFRQLGFEAIKYSSSVGNGDNILVFNPKSFSYIQSKENQVYKIDSLQYQVTQLK